MKVLLVIVLLAGAACASWYVIASGRLPTQSAVKDRQPINPRYLSIGQEPSASDPNTPERLGTQPRVVRLPETLVITWLTDYDQALTTARSRAKLVVIDFYGAWCTRCTMMDKTTFSHVAVRHRMADFVPLKIDVDRQPELAARYEVTGLPATVVVDPDGKEFGRAVGYLDPDRYLKVLDRAAATAMQAQLGIRGHLAPGLEIDHWYNLPQDKKAIDVDDYRGKVVYLYAFQSWCPGCHRYGFPTLTALIEHYKKIDDVAFIAVQTTFEGFDTNTEAHAKETADRYGLTIPVGQSGSAQQPSAVMQHYRTGGTPWTVIIDRDGTVQFNDFHIRPGDAVRLIDRLRADDDR